jgi:ribonuclease T1
MARMALVRLLLALSFAWLCLVPAAHARGPVLALGSPPGEITVAQLPPEARETLAAIRRGGPFRYEKDGTVFGNREGLLPRRERGYYTEYTVRTPGARDRGARRIVAGGDPRSSGEYYYTSDHYQSFRRIRE